MYFYSHEDVTIEANVGHLLVAYIGLHDGLWYCTGLRLKERPTWLCTRFVDWCDKKYLLGYAW